MDNRAECANSNKELVAAKCEFEAVKNEARRWATPYGSSTTCFCVPNHIWNKLTTAADKVKLLGG